MAWGPERTAARSLTIPALTARDCRNRTWSRLLHCASRVQIASPSWMLIRIALETKAHHAGADSDRLSLLEAPTPARYRTFLENVFAFESRFEEALIQTPNLPTRIVRARTKTERLRNDLMGLGATPTEIANLARPLIPRFTHAPQAMGWLYVVERNTLLHGLLRRHLWRMLPTTISRAGTYLAANTDEAGAQFRALGADLDAIARQTIPSEIVIAAHAAFACQRLWFAHARASRRLAS